MALSKPGEMPQERNVVPADDAKAQMGHATDQVNDLYLIPESEDFQRREEQVLKMQALLMGEASGIA